MNLSIYKNIVSTENPARTLSIERWPTLTVNKSELPPPNWIGIVERLNGRESLLIRGAQDLTFFGPDGILEICQFRSGIFRPYVKVDKRIHYGSIRWAHVSFASLGIRYQKSGSFDQTKATLSFDTARCHLELASCVALGMFEWSRIASK